MGGQLFPVADINPVMSASIPARFGLAVADVERASRDLYDSWTVRCFSTGIVGPAWWAIFPNRTSCLRGPVKAAWCGITSGKGKRELSDQEPEYRCTMVGAARRIS